MQKTEQFPKPNLVRTTVRLPRSLYQRLKRRSIDEGQPLQALIITDLERAEVRQAFIKADDILKYTIRQGKKPGMPRHRGDLYA